MQLIISIVSWNTRDLLRDCLLSLNKYIRSGHTRVVVIDNASSDGSPEMVRREFPAVQVIESGGNLGFGRAHNLIARESREPFILFLNPDTVFVENAHEKMLEVMEGNAEIGAASCMLVDSDGTVNPLGIQWYPSPVTELFTQLFFSRRIIEFCKPILPYQDPFQSGFVKKLYGGCLMVRRNILDKVGWFDERFFMYAEDVDLSRRITTGGAKLYYLGTAKVIHTGAGASSKAPGKFAVLMQSESVAKLIHKYYGRLGHLVYKAAVFTRALLRLVFLTLVHLPLSFFRPSRASGWKHSQSKQLALLKWSLGLAQAAIPR